MRISTLLLCALSVLSTSECYKILVLFPVPSKSHTLLGKGVVNALLKAGHEVTFVMPYPGDERPVTNLTIIDNSITTELEQSTKCLQEKETNLLSFVTEFARNITILTYKNPAFSEVMLKQQFDAVVTDWFFSDTDCGYAAVQQVPWILITGTVLQPLLENLVDDVRSITTIPFMLHNFPIPMNFWQRVVNFVSLALLYVSNMPYTYEQAARYQEFFAPLAAARGVQLPSYWDALYNISFMLVNSHPSIAPALSLPPNVIDIAGYHIKEETAPLPQDLQQLLDSSPDGVVYFSMGSILKSSDLPEKTKKDIIQILSQLPFTVLWKFEEDVKGMPKNVHIRPWWPQPSILAHPKLRLFITHGGQLSLIEAIHYGVPLLAIPVYGDQSSNANGAVRAGYAMKVPYSEDMGPELKSVLNDMLTDDRYYKQAKYLSKLFNKRPVPPAQLVSHYVELAIESKGALHFRSKTRLYHWYQRWMLDQVAVFLVILLAIRAVVKKIFRKFRKNAPTKVKKN